MSTPPGVVGHVCAGEGAVGDLVSEQAAVGDVGAAEAGVGDLSNADRSVGHLDGVESAVGDPRRRSHRRHLRRVHGSVDDLLRLTAFASMSAPRTSSSLSSWERTEPFSISREPTLSLANAQAPPPRAMNSAEVAITFA